MGKSLLLAFLTFLFPAVAFSTEIRDTISVSQEVKPDVYCVSVTISVRGSSEAEVLGALTKADDYVRALKLPYEGGNFTVLPNREWNPVEKRYRIVGFVGRIDYRFLLKSPSQQDEVIRALEEAKRGAPVNYTVSSVGWCISEKLRKKFEKQLKLKALKEAELEASLFGRELRSKCFLKKVSFSVGRAPVPLSPLRVESVRAPKPPQSPQKVEVKASVLINCK